MQTQESFQLSDFDYSLPEGLIAKYPAEKRDQSRMLVVNRVDGSLQHDIFSNLPQYVDPGDVVVLNNAKVMPARLIGTREGHSGEVEIFLLCPENQARTTWQVLMRPARKLSPGTVVVFSSSPLRATILERFEEGKGLVSLDWPEGESLEAMLEQTGKLPIPPYMSRDAEALDTERYQTVYAKVPGAQAAPTAGLHFTPQVLQALKDKGVHVVEVTLNVSSGTFRPVIYDDIKQHAMDAEYYTVSEDAAKTIEQARKSGKRVIAIGTTVTKTLETVAFHNQGHIVAESRWSELFITPGFRYQVTDTLLTNFHLPKSTLLMLVSAFTGHKTTMNAYETAIQNQYRFYSYGDCMLIL